MIGGELNSVLSENEFAFVKTYNALTTLKLKPLEYLILNEILSFNINGMEYTGSFNYFCRKYNTAHTTVLRALKSLTDKGYIIKKTSKGGDKTSIYRINEEKLIPVFLNTKETLGLKDISSSETLGLKDTSSSETLGTPYQNARASSSETLHNKNIYKNNNKNKYIDHQSTIDGVCDFSSLDTETGLQEAEYPSSYQKDHEQKDNPKTEGKDQASAMTEKEKEKSRQKKEKKEGKYTKQDYIEDIEAYTNNTELQAALLDFYNMRKNAINKLISTKGTTKRLLNKLDKLAETDEEKSAIVYKAVDNCWQGFYGQNKKAADESQQPERSRYSKQFDEPDEKPIDPVQQAANLERLREARKKLGQRS